MSPQEEPEQTVREPEPTVKDIVRVTVKEPVRGMRRARGKDRKPRARRARLDTHVMVDPRVMEAAKAAMRPGQQLVIDSETVVRLVNR